MTKINAMQVLKDLEYVRTGGSKEELKAAQYIQSKLSEIGIESVIEDFEVQSSEILECELKVTKPYEKTIPCKGYYNALEAKNLKAPFYYLEDRNDVALNEVKGKIVMADGYLSYWLYKDLVEHGAAGFILFNGSLYEENDDIGQRELRESQAELGKLPGIQINVKEAYEMVLKGAEEVEISLKEKVLEGNSRNVVADIKGQSEHTIVFTAHYDSSALSKGSYDNASGSVGILKIAEYFKENAPLHNLRFIWCGSEERGLLGSKAYVKDHEEELKNIDLVINLDMIGSTMGKFVACCTSEEKLVSYIDYLSKEVAFPLRAYQDVYSSDSTPFADKGIPAVSFARLTNVTPIHCRHDNMSAMKEGHVLKDIEFIETFAARMANAKIIPVKREMPEKMKQKLDQYLLRKKPE